MKKEFAIDLYKKLEFAAGEHRGRWDEGDFNNHASSEVFYYDVCQIAEHLDIKIPEGDELDEKLKELEEDCIDPLDCFAFIMKEKCEEKLLKIIKGDEKMFDINLYTALVVLSSQTVDSNIIEESDLYDFAELDETLKTGVVKGSTGDVDIGSLYPDQYADIYDEWIAEATRRYEEMRNEFLRGE